MIEVFGITEEWQTADLITTQPRTLKKLVREYNNHFGEDETHSWYIVSGSKGYRLTQDKNEILDSLVRDKSNTLDRLKQSDDRLKLVMDYFSQNERLPI